MTDNREYRARIHIMVDDIESNHRLRQLHALIYRMHERDVADIESNHRLRQLHALIYRMHERDVADRLRTERQEGTEDGNAE